MTEDEKLVVTAEERAEREEEAQREEAEAGDKRRGCGEAEAGSKDGVRECFSQNFVFGDFNSSSEH